MPDLSTPAAPSAGEPFRSRRGRAMALVLASAAVLLFGAIAVFMQAWAIGDRVMLFLLGLGLAGFLWRYAAIAAHARPDGLHVRNLFLSQTVPWDDIVGVRFPEGDAWAVLDLTEGDTLAVMAVQRADGERGQSEGLRLAQLVHDHQAGLRAQGA